MDLRSKLRSLVRKQDTGIPDLASPDDAPNDFVFEPTVTIQAIGRTDKSTSSSDRANILEAEVLRSIEEQYYSEDLFDAGDYELQKLNGNYELDKVDALRKSLRGQLEVVTRKLSEVILQNRAAYTEELKRVTEIENGLAVTVETSRKARRATEICHGNFAAQELKLLQLHSRGQRCSAFFHALMTIKSLRRTISEVENLLEEGNFAEAIELTLSCRVTAKALRQYNCVSQIYDRLQEGLVDVESKLDIALNQLCQEFDPKVYVKVYHAYQLLDKNQTAVDQLHMHFVTRIHNESFGIVLRCVEQSSHRKVPLESLLRKPYQELCHFIAPEHLVVTLLTLCKALWEVMKTYRAIVQWHLDLASQRKGAENPGAVTDTSAPDRDLVEVYVLHKLESGPSRLWSDMEQKVRSLLTQSDAASHLKYDGFGHLLAVLKRFTLVGKEFGAANSVALMDAVRQQASRFFSAYHKTKLEELHFFVDNESWEVCPLKNRFTCFDLWEFRFLKPRAGTENSMNSLRTQTGFFSSLTGQESPFDDVLHNEERSEDVLLDVGEGDKTLSDSDDDVMEELKQEHIDETGERRTFDSVRQRRSSAFKSIALGGPVVTNSTLSVLRLFGRYLFFMSMLETNAPEVVNALSQLFDYYFYTVFSLFSTDIHEYFEAMVISKRLTLATKRIHENLISTQSDHVEMGAEGRIRIPAPHISPRINLSDSSNLFSLPERMAAMESLAFLASQLDSLQPILERALPPQRRVFLQQFYTQSVALVPDVRPPVYWCVVYRSINYDTALTTMTEMQWDIKHLASHHSEYVDHLLKELEHFNRSLKELSKIATVTKDVSDTLWTLVVWLTNRTFVEGFSGAKKCSNEGRALMQLDYQQFIMNAEKLTLLRPVPDREFVDAYVKAFYLPEDALEKWVKDHKEYTLKHITGLLHHAPSLSKKSRQRLLQYIEDPDGVKSRK
ncbi:hypothetical protein RvY_12734 [Ramazzottius varieornatus]|uniref:Syndetin C-terminal domain-containing protein n=1 Tax=Ramazzottius varieornatus TaxID=947166 RepID=A0A1D1VKH7_RAMVA|nr:hypothetical protein RvY_12734 [Ramazzottius varieornatus]